jgi:hypothetical protein
MGTHPIPESISSVTELHDVLLLQLIPWGYAFDSSKDLPERSGLSQTSLCESSHLCGVVIKKPPQRLKDAKNH